MSLAQTCTSRFARLLELSFNFDSAAALQRALRLSHCNHSDMKWILLLCALFEYTVCGAQTRVVQVAPICAACKPTRVFGGDSQHVWVFAGAQFSSAHTYRTTNGGVDWHKLGLAPGGSIDKWERPTVLESMIFIYTQERLMRSLDSGRSWSSVFTYPTAEALWMHQVDSGVALVRTEDRFGLRWATDSGEFVYETDSIGYSYQSSSDVSATLRRDDSTYYILHTHPTTLAQKLRFTTDFGSTWNTREPFDDQANARGAYLFSGNSPEMLYVHGVGELFLAFSSTGGRTWSVRRDTIGPKIYRMISEGEPGKPEILWAAAGEKTAYPDFDLLIPGRPGAFATRLLRSTDTGRTWEEVDYRFPGGRIADILPIDGGVLLILWRNDSTFSARVLMSSSSVEHRFSKVYPFSLYPSVLEADDRINLRSTFSGPVKLIIRDMLDREITILSETQNALGDRTFLIGDLQPGYYFVYVKVREQVLGSRKIIKF